VFSKSPCRETPKNALKTKKQKVRTYFFCELAQMYVVFSFYFFLSPLGPELLGLQYSAGALLRDSFAPINTYANRQGALLRDSSASMNK
jgi:hypothetical protein